METKRKELTMAKNIFISFLGTGHYKECQYDYRLFDGNKRKVTFIQEATLDYLLSQKKFDDNSIAYILLTGKARESNWDDGYDFELEDGTVETQEEGLCSRLEKLKKKKAKEGVVFNYKDIDISDESEKDIWVLFSDLYNLLVKEEQENDINLYVDITHSFRYLPMFLIVFINYVKLFKNVTVEHISYGNYEGRDKKTNVAPIVDLTDYSKLQDWTYAIRSFIESGNANALVALCNQGNSDLANILNIVVADFQTCRSIPIVDGNHIAKLKKEIGKYSSIVNKSIQENESNSDSKITPFNNILSELEHQLAVFQRKKVSDEIDTENVTNGYEASIWCFNRQLYQQAITILQENLITEQCLTDGKYHDFEWKDGYGEGKYHKSIRADIEYEDQSLYDIVSNVRNDFNHAGFSMGTSEQYPNGWEWSKIKKDLIDVFSKLLTKKFNGKKKMTEKNGFPYIENINSKSKNKTPEFSNVSTVKKGNQTSTPQKGPEILRTETDKPKGLSIVGKIDLDKIQNNKKRK